MPSRMVMAALVALALAVGVIGGMAIPRGESRSPVDTVGQWRC